MDPLVALREGRERHWLNFVCISVCSPVVQSGPDVLLIHRHLTVFSNLLCIQIFEMWTEIDVMMSSPRLLQVLLKLHNVGRYGPALRWLFLFAAWTR